MKTHRKTQIAFLLLSTLVGLSGCGNSQSSDGTALSTATTYYLSNGYCYASNTGQVVANGYCGVTTATTTTTGYYILNGYCYSNATGQTVSNSYCGLSTTTTSTAATTQVCVGYYYYYSAYGIQVGYCNGSNCAGYTLYQYGTNQQVACQ